MLVIKKLEISEIDLKDSIEKEINKIFDKLEKIIFKNKLL